MHCLSGIYFDVKMSHDCTLMEKSSWINNAEGNWTVLSKSPLVYRADGDNCKITVSKDEELLRTLLFKKNTVVRY